jgi:hypothetical protein
MITGLRRLCFTLLTVSLGAAAAADSFQIIRPLLDQTVEIGSDVTFAATYRAPEPVTFKWQHDGTIVDLQTNATLTLKNVQPTDIGTYTLTIASVTSILTSSAILDIDQAYPAARFTSISPVFGIDPDAKTGIYQIMLGAFADGTIATIRGFVQGFYNPYHSWNWIGTDPNSGRVLWTNFSDTGFYAYWPRVIGGLANDGNLIGYFRSGGSLLENTIFSVRSSGEVNWTVAQSADVFLDETLNINLTDSPYRSLQRAMVLASNGQIILSKSISGLYGYGRFFYGSVTNTPFLSDIGYTPQKSPTQIYGAFRLSGELEWVAEKQDSTNFWEPPIPAGPSVQRGTLVMSATPVSQLYTNSQGTISTNAGFIEGVAKILSSGERAWMVETDNQEVRSYHFNNSGQLVGFMVNTGKVSVGSFTLPADTNAPLVYFQIDRAGAVRTAARLRCRGFDKFANRGSDLDLTHRGPGKYQTVLPMQSGGEIGDYAVTSSTNLWYVAQIDAPDPFPQTSPAPPTTNTLAESGSITLSATPNLPGLVLYQWFRDGQIVSSATNHDLTLNNFHFAESGLYSVKIRNAYGAVTNPVATVNFDGAANLAVDLGPSQSSLALRWPTNAQNLRLEQTTDLNLPFSSVSTPLITNVTQGRIETFLPITSTNLYLRLHHP